MKDFKKPSYSKGGFSARPSFAAKRGPRAYGADSDRPVERHQATCNECHKKCEVPFRPNGKKPVYCRDCFKGKESEPSYGRTPASHESSDLKKQLGILNTKLDKLIGVIEAQSALLSRSK